MKRHLIAAVCTSCAVLSWALPAPADQIEHLYQLNVTVSATSSDGMLAASHTFSIPHGIIDANELAEFTVVSRDSPYYLMSGSTVLGTITDLELGVQPDPVVKLKFAVTAGDTDTPFTITSAIVPVSPTYVNPLANASAGITLSDDGDGSATLTGSFPGGKAYEALYNGTNVIRTLVDPVTTDFTATGSEAWGPQQVFGTVNVISSQFQFVLSHGDDASGTSLLQVTVPEPGSLVLVVIGGILALATGFGWRRMG